MFNEIINFRNLIMAGKSDHTELQTGLDSKKLVIAIYDFLLQERFKKKDYTKKEKCGLSRAANCLQKVYEIRFMDCGGLRDMAPLREIFSLAYRPVTIKDKLSAQSHKRRGNDLMDAGEYGQAEVEYTTAANLDPHNAIYYCNRAASRTRQGLFGEAVTDCNKALKLDGNYVKAYNWLGIAYVMMDHSGKAARCYRKALRIEPGNSCATANMDLISQNLNRRAFRVFEPLYRYSRSLIRAAANIRSSKKLFEGKFDNDANSKTAQKERNLQIQKLDLGDLD